MRPMKHCSLQITYLHGKPLAAYLYLGTPGAEAARTLKKGKGLVVDYDAEGNPIGIEITAPAFVTPDDVNGLLVELHQEAIAEEELAPLRSA